MANLNKKDYILLLLEKLWEDFPMALGLRYLVEQDKLGEDLFEIIFDIFKAAVDKKIDQWKQEKLERSIDVMEKIKNIEIQTQEKEQSELANLESMIDAI